MHNMHPTTFLPAFQSQSTLWLKFCKMFKVKCSPELNKFASDSQQESQRVHNKVSMRFTSMVRPLHTTADMLSPLHSFRLAACNGFSF